MEKLTFKDLVLLLKEKDYLTDKVPKQIKIEADECKVLVQVNYNCTLTFTETVNAREEIEK